MDRRPRRRFLGATLPHLFLSLSLSLLLGVPDLFATDPPAGPPKGCVKNGTDTLHKQLPSDLRIAGVASDAPGSPAALPPIPVFTALVPVDEALTSPYIVHRYASFTEMHDGENLLRSPDLPLIHRKTIEFLESGTPPFVASLARDRLVALLNSTAIKDDVFGSPKGSTTADVMRFFERLTADPRGYLPNLTASEIEQVGKLAQELRTAVNDKYLLRHTEYLDAVAKIAIERKAGRVSSPRAPPKASETETPGLYSSIPTGKPFTNKRNGDQWDRVVSDDGTSFYTMTYGSGITAQEVTHVNDASGKQIGRFNSQLAENNEHFVFSFAKRSAGAPSFVKLPGVPDMVPGRGTPMVIAARLLQLKRAGIRRGSLKKAYADTMTNGTTICELLQDPEIRAWIRRHPQGAPPVPDHLLEKAMLNTQTGRYIQSTMLQAGHRITGVKVFGGRVATIQDIISWSSREGTPIDSAMIEAALFEGTGPSTSVLRPDVLFPLAFHVEFTLAPL
jgi:hypothetical protein